MFLPSFLAGWAAQPEASLGSLSRLEPATLISLMDHLLGLLRLQTVPFSYPTAFVLCRIKLFRDERLIVQANQPGEFLCLMLLMVIGFISLQPELPQAKGCERESSSWHTIWQKSSATGNLADRNQPLRLFRCSPLAPAQLLWEKQYFLRPILNRHYVSGCMLGETPGRASC